MSAALTATVASNTVAPVADGTPINDPNAPANVRAPRLRVLVNGKPVGGAKKAGLVSNNHYQADTFSASFSANADPAFNVIWWATQEPPLVLDMQLGIVGAGNAIAWTSLLIGEVDKVDVHDASGAVEITGRDLTGRFIEAKTQESFNNNTASEIVTILAGRHGMTADVTPTTALASRLWAADHTRASNGQFGKVTNEWDLMTALARDEGFDLYVTGTVLHFHPAVAPGADPYLVRYTMRGTKAYPVSNAIDLRLGRSLTLAKDIEVIVQSFHSKAGKSFKRTAKVHGGGKKGDKPQQYFFVRPNLTEDQAQKLANSILADLSKHERTISWSEPGNFILTARTLVKLQGTGTDFDQVYYVDSIDRHISFDEGFGMSVRAKNHSTQSQAAL